MADLKAPFPADTSEAAAVPIFIVGAPRSGTTLMQYMLRSHPVLSVPTGESQFIIPLMRHAQSIGNPPLGEAGIRRLLQEMYERNARFLDTDLDGVRFDIDTLTERFVVEGRTDVRGVITGLFEANAAGQGKTRWLDKTPYYVLHMPALQAWWPQAKFVHLIRDGRDVALSLLERRHDFGLYNLYFAARYWDQYVSVGRDLGSELPAGQYLEIGYRDLVRDPQSVLRRLCDFLEIAFNASMLDFKPSAETGKTPLLRGPVLPENDGRWRQRLSPRQLRVFEGGAAPALRRFGYELATPGKALPLAWRAFYRAHNRVAKLLFDLRARGQAAALPSPPSAEHVSLQQVGDT